MKEKDFMNGTYTSHAAFIFVDELYPKTENLYTLASNTYLSIASDDLDREAEYAHKLYTEMRRQDMEPCGDYLCEVLSQFPLSTSGKLIYKIQIPVRRVWTNSITIIRMKGDYL